MYEQVVAEQEHHHTHKRSKCICPTFEAGDGHGPIHEELEQAFGDLLGAMLIVNTTASAMVNQHATQEPVPIEEPHELIQSVRQRRDV